MDPFTWGVRVPCVILNLFTLMFSIFIFLMSSFGLRQEGDGGIYLMFFSWICLVLSIFGTIALMSQNLTMTWIYTSIMFVLVIINVAFLFTILSIEQLEEGLIDNLDHSFPEDELEIDIAQQSYNCCGHFGPGDYAKYGLDLLDSCYEDKENNIVYQKGCYNNMVATIKLFVVHTYVILWLYLVFQFATFLLCSIILLRSRINEDELTFRDVLNLIFRCSLS